MEARPWVFPAWAGLGLVGVSASGSFAAEEAGFRPCMRCRPETAPGSPAWLGTSTTVQRAVRMILAGSLEGEGVEELAERLGVGARHLRRLFARHVGASPRAIARTRRVHFARKLLEETDLSMVEVAESAGFTSVRRFNAEIADTFRKPPSALRGNGIRSEAPLCLRLPYKAPFDWASMIAFLGARATPGVEKVDPDAYLRSIQVEGAPALLEVRRGGGAHLEVRLTAPPGRSLVGLLDRVSRLFDLGADPIAIDAHLRRDARLRPKLRVRPGLRIPGAWDGFEVAVRAILGQQVSVRGATTLAGRLAERFGEAIEPARSRGLTRLFPRAEVLAEADVASIGLPAARARAIGELAERVATGALVLDGSSDPDATRARLLAIRGVGPWTADYVAMRVLAEPDAFPSGDLALRRALGPRALSAVELSAEAEAWRPFRAYAAMHLWMDGR